MVFVGKILNKLFVSAQVFGSEQLKSCDDIIYVLETSRSEHVELLHLSLKKQGVVLNSRRVLSVDKASEKSLVYRLESLIEKIEFSENSNDVSIVPVTILHGHFPSRESSWWRVVFSERWGPKGWWRRLLMLIVNGRQTLLQLDKPLSLKEMMYEDGLLPSSTRAEKIVVLLRDHFRQRRLATYGPDLSNRREVIEKIINQQDVLAEIEAYSLQKGIELKQAEAYARQQLKGIATNLSPSFIRFFSGLLNWFFKRTYRNVKFLGTDKVRQTAKDYQLVFLPCHRSHMDYVLVSWGLHNHGLVIPHVIAGDNLNAPVLGSALKLGGAVFMRRSFYDDALYAILFKNYIKQLHASGHALEYFIEGGRSRTGRLLAPKIGMMSLTLEASLQPGIKPIAIVPVSISYDKLVETRSYANQLNNHEKRPESISGLFKSLKMFKGEMGDVAISYADPIIVSDNFSKFEDIKTKSQYLVRRVMEQISLASYVNETALIATVLLSQRRLRLSKDQLIERVNQLSTILVNMPNAPAGIAKGDVAQWIADAAARDQVCVNNSDVYLSVDQACEMTFYRNQIHHLTLLAGLYLLVSKRYHSPLGQSVPKLIKAVYPYLAKEMFWPWQGKEVDAALKDIKNLLINQQLIVEDDKSLVVRNTSLSVSLMQTVEPYLLRYYIVFRLLHQFNDLSETDLVDESVRLAGMLHVEFGFHSPEYTDSKGIASFVKSMQEQEVLAINEDGAIYPCVDASGLMQRSKQILLAHYVELIEQNLR
ncbi:1-acyl-sn-glycerol-3-phosphate acyltransferase [Gammaproteobacteria bacterium AS21]|jgi:glycerol-3-phosphate O-acyltransferase